MKPHRQRCCGLLETTKWSFLHVEVTLKGCFSDFPLVLLPQVPFLDLTPSSIFILHFLTLSLTLPAWGSQLHYSLYLMYDNSCCVFCVCVWFGIFYFFFALDIRRFLQLSGCDLHICLAQFALHLLFPLGSFFFVCLLVWRLFSLSQCQND